MIHRHEPVHLEDLSDRPSSERTFHRGGPKGGGYSGPLWTDSRYELPSPPAGRCWCDRCRMELGRSLEATHPASRMVMVSGSRPPLVSLVCRGCLREDDEVLEVGGRDSHPNRMREAKERKRAAKEEANSD